MYRYDENGALKPVKMQQVSLTKLRDIWMGEPMDFAEEFPRHTMYLDRAVKEEYRLTYPNGRALHVALNGMHERYPFVALEMAIDPTTTDYRYVHSEKWDTYYAFTKKELFEGYLREFGQWEPLYFSGLHRTGTTSYGVRVRLGDTIMWRPDREKTVLPKSLYEYARTVLEY